MQGDMKEQWKRRILAVALAVPLMAAVALALPLMAPGYSTSASMVAPTAQLPPTAAQTPPPAEVLVTTAEEVAGAWKLDTEAGWMRLYFENGHFRYQFEEATESGSFWFRDGELTMAGKANQHSYLVYAKKEGGQPAQLRFASVYQWSEWDPAVMRGSGWEVNVDGKTLSRIKR